MKEKIKTNDYIRVKRIDSLNIAKLIDDVLHDNMLTPANRKNLKALTLRMKEIIDPVLPGFNMSTEITEEIQINHYFKGFLEAITFEFMGEKFTLRNYIDTFYIHFEKIK